MYKLFIALVAALALPNWLLAESLGNIANDKQIKVGKYSDKTHVTYLDNAVRIDIEPKSGRWQGVALSSAKGPFFDLSKYAIVAVDVENNNDHPTRIWLEVVNYGPNGKFSNIANAPLVLLPHEKGSLRVRYGRAAQKVDWEPKNMRHLFDGFEKTRHNKHTIYTTQVKELRIWAASTDKQLTFTLSNVRMEELAKPLPEAIKSKETFYPFIDSFGQYKHLEWEGKIHNIDDLHAEKEREDQFLKDNPGIADRTRFGGWASGPTFEQFKGRWGTVKYKGKWYFVDPEGKLFWSLGMNAVMINDDETAITLREHYFEKIPEITKENRGCFLFQRFPRFDFYKGKKIDSAKIKRFSFLRHNALLKYGTSNYYHEFLARSQKRLKSWGFNTNGNWLDQNVLKHEHLPYMSAVTYRKFYQVIEGCEMRGWQKFPDVFNPHHFDGLVESLRTTFKHTVKDPYCIGYFVDNELTWGDEIFLAKSVIRSPATQPAKQAMKDHLEKKYGEVSALNQAWGTTYGSWDDFLKVTELPDLTKSRNDLEAFNDIVVNRYFANCRRAINQEAPGKLYFGCRFAGHNARVVKTAAKYMDACSFNVYQPEVSSWKFPADVDLPMVVGEWHFGTTVRGLLSPGLDTASCATEQDRGRAFDRYVRSALWNPVIAGVHYFKYSDQATSGRSPDGENFQCGFIDVTDTPYRELVDAARNVSNDLYEYRVRTNSNK